MGTALADKLGRIIYEVRQERRLTVSEAAAKARISKAQWSKIEAGRHWPGERSILWICLALGVNPSEILYGLADSLNSMESNYSVIQSYRLDEKK